MTNLDSVLKSRDITLPTEVRLVKAMVFQWSCMGVRVGLWRKLSAKNWCFWTVVLEKTLESPLDCKEIQPVHPNGDQSWVFIGRTYAKGETPILWPPHAKSWLTGKDSCWEGLRAGGEGEDRGWDGWMASPTQWTWIWVNSGSWWWTGRPAAAAAKSLQLCPTLCDPTEGSCAAIHGIAELDTTEQLNWSDPLKYSSLEHSMDCIVQRVAKNRIWLSDFHFDDLSLEVRLDQLVCIYIWFGM